MIIRAIFAVLFATLLAAAANAATTDSDTISACLKSAAEGTAGARACIGQIAGPCLEKPEGQSGPGEIDCIMGETAAWDTILNAEYQRLLPLLQKEAVDDVRKAQRLWVEARDADCRVPYYFYGGGTIVKTLGAECERDHTADRAILIKQWREMAQPEQE
jgi:uncharacterized protein YecT (DUF1311 family)